MAASDARPVPRRNVAYRAYFPIHDTAGALITGATGLDSEFSGDGAAFTDCAAEATEIGASGVYFLDLSATEMDFDNTTVVVKTTSVNAIIPVLVFYPESIGDYRIDPATTIAGILTTPGQTIDTTAAGEVSVDPAQVAALLASIIAGILTTPGQTIDTTAAGEVTIDPAQVTALISSVAAAILVTPANKLLTDAAGRVELQPDGLDQIVVESGMNARQALSPIAAALAGVLAGAGTASVTIQAANDPGTTRISAVVDAVGNRATVTLTLPA